MKYSSRPKRPRLFFVEAPERDEPWATAFTVYESDDQDDGFTGVYDANGDPIFRDKPPFGFVGNGSE